MTALKIGVVGAGAMGSLFGGYLSAGGNEVWLVDKWGEHVRAIQRRGLVIVEQSGDETSGDEEAGNETVCRPRAVERAAGVGVCDLVFVFVKSYDTASATHQVAALLDSKTVVVTLQNGLGNREALESRVPAHQILVGVTGQAANVLGPGRIHHAGSGETILCEIDGSSSERVCRVAGALNRAGLATSIGANVHAVVWGKVLINAAINPMTALLGVRNGLLLRIPSALEVMKSAIDEIVEVARVRGIALPYDDPWEKVLDVARLTGDNRSSMLQDVEAGRGTEIDAINGAVAKEAADRGVPAPVNLTLTRLIKAIEARAGLRG